MTHFESLFRTETDTNGTNFQLLLVVQVGSDSNHWPSIFPSYGSDYLRDSLQRGDVGCGVASEGEIYCK